MVTSKDRELHEACGRSHPVNLTAALHHELMRMFHSGCAIVVHGVRCVSASVPPYGKGFTMAQAPFREMTNWRCNSYLFLFSQFMTGITSMIVQYAIIWYLTQESGSATILSYATLLAMLPMVLLSPFVGTFIDRWNKRLCSSCPTSWLPPSGHSLRGWHSEFHLPAVAGIRLALRTFTRPGLPDAHDSIDSADHRAG
jgi:hypothetical protein